MGLIIEIKNIVSPNNFKVFYKQGRTPGSSFEQQSVWTDQYTGGTSVGGVFSGGTTTISIDFETEIDVNPFGKQYWFKILDVVTNSYIIENIYIHDLVFYDELCAIIPTPTPTSTPEPTATPAPTATDVPEPTATGVPEPTATGVPESTATPTPTDTGVPEPTATDVPEPTATPVPTATDVPEPTSTPAPTATDGPTLYTYYVTTFVVTEVPDEIFCETNYTTTGIIKSESPTILGMLNGFVYDSNNDLFIVGSGRYAYISTELGNSSNDVNNDPRYAIEVSNLGQVDDIYLMNCSGGGGSV